MFLILCLQSWAWWYWEQCLRSRSPSCIWTSVSRQTHRGRRSSRVYIYVRMSGDRKYRCGRDTCTTVGASSTTNSTSCWASILVSLASDLLWEPAKLAIGVAELCARTTGHGRWVLRRLVTKVGNVMVTLWQRLCIISEMKTRFWPRQPCTNTRISQQPHKHSTPDTTSHSIGKAPVSDLVQGRVPHFWCRNMGSCWDLGSEYGYISIAKGDGRHTWELTLLNEVVNSRVSMDVSNLSVS